MTNSNQNSGAAEKASPESQKNDGKGSMNRKIDVSIRKMQGEWRVVHGPNNSRSPIELENGDTVSFKATGSDVSIQFPKNDLFGNDIYVLRKTDPPTELRLQPQELPKDYAYAVFVHDDLVYAVGQSPPRIIVK